MHAFAIHETHTHTTSALFDENAVKIAMEKKKQLGNGRKCHNVSCINFRRLKIFGRVDDTDSLNGFWVIFITTNLTITGNDKWVNGNVNIKHDYFRRKSSPLSCVMLY